MPKPEYIERFRQLPYSGSLQVETGDWVNEMDVIGRLPFIPGAIRRIPAAPLLRIEGHRLAEHMLLPEGASVERGDVVAAADCFGDRRAVSSPYQGVIGLVSRSLGHIYIREAIPIGPNDEVRLNVVDHLGLKPLFFNDCLRVKLNHVVIPGQVVAVSGVGPTARLVQSPIYGKVVDITGTELTIKPIYVSTDLRAYLAGKVISVIPGQGVTIGSYAYVIHGQYGVGGEAGGELLVVRGPEKELQSADVTSSWQGKVIFGGNTAGLDVLRQAEAAGTRALILGYLPMRTLMNFVGTSTLGLTGNEDIDMSIVLLSGFLPSTIAEDTWNTISMLDGHFASVNGTTHVRAGAVRPEVVFCERQWPTDPIMSKQDDLEIAVGSAVRIVREPHFGMTGLVLELPAERQTIETGSKVRVAKLLLHGQAVVVPVSNLALCKATEEGVHHA